MKEIGKELRRKGLLYIMIISLIPTAAFAYTFTRDLTINSTGPDVIELQNILINESLLNIPASISKGYFGALTQEALKKYQIKTNITPASGYFGPITRSHLNSPRTETPLPPKTPDFPYISTNTVTQKQYYGEQLTKTSEKAPRITNVSVSEATITDRITVIGENFGSKVTIYSSIGILKDKKVNDNKVIFNFSEIIGNVSELGGLPVTFSVGTSHGISSEYGRVMIK